MELSLNNDNEKARSYSYKNKKKIKIFKEEFNNNNSQQKNKKRNNSFFQRKDKIIYNIRVNLLKEGKECKIITLSNPDKNEEEKKSIEYVNIGFLGKGAYGECYIYESTKDFNQYAAKLVNKNKLKRSKAKQSIISEIKIQQSLNHPKIVKIKSCSEDNDYVYIIQELCKNRSLADLLIKRDHLSEFEVQSYMFQLIQGLKYLHDKNIIHRDLKTNNIFLNDQLELKIGDFGLIAKLEGRRDRRNTFCGTTYYMAPEVINPGKKGYSFEVDIWSMGVIMYKLLTGKYPFDDNDENIVYKKILDGHFSFPEKPYISNVAKDLIKQILVIDPKLRPGLNQIIYHDFFHMNIFPKYPDIKFYTQEPSPDEKRKYMPDIDNDHKEVKIKELYKLIVNDIHEVKYEDIKQYDLNNLNNSLSEINKVEYWITYLHDSRYGFCYYQVNNGLAGIIYKKEQEINYNGTHLIFNSDDNILYEINNDDEINSYEVDKCPDNLKEKFDEFMTYHIKTKNAINRAENAKNHKNENTEKNSEKNKNNSISEVTLSQSEENSISSKTNSNDISINTSKEKEKTILVYIKCYMKSNKATILILSDNTIQAVFKDKSQILIGDQEKKEIVINIDVNKNKTLLPLSNILNNSNKELVEKLRLIRKIGMKTVRENILKKFELDHDERQDEKKDSNQEDS